MTADLPLGWKQRLALGCAVLHEPPILFLDEPTSGVDPMSRRSFWELIYALSGRGTTIFVSTHYMEEAEYCNRLALMNRGRIVALDRPAALRTRMTEPILEIATDNGPRGRAGAAARRRRDRGRDVRPRRARRRGRRGAGPRHAARFFRTRGLRCDRITTVRPSLEDVFVSLVRREGGAVEG